MNVASGENTEQEGVWPAREIRRAERLSLLIWMVARFIGMTMRIQYRNLDRIQKTVDSGGGAILVTWHGRTLIPANVLRGRGYWALISLSRDGEIQDRVFRRFGFQTVRGSTGRGGVRAALLLAKRIREGGVLAFTPDGPRGPSHQVQEGTIFLAQRSGCPVIPCGMSARPRRIIKSWDSYMVPLPFSRGAFVVGEPVFFTPDLTDEEKEIAMRRLGIEMNRAERTAEEMMGFSYPAEWTTE